VGDAERPFEVGAVLWVDVLARVALAADAEEADGADPVALLEGGRCVLAGFDDRSCVSS
jgi:hypothetical protein